MKSYAGGIRHDYKDIPDNAPAAYWRHGLLFVLGASLPLITLLVVMRSEPSANDLMAESPSLTDVRQERAPTQSISANSVLERIEVPPIGLTKIPVDSGVETLQLSVRRGDTLESLFRRNGLRIADLAAMVALPDAREHLRLLRPGDHLEIQHADGSVHSLTRELDEVDLLAINRNGDGFDSRIVSREVEYRVVGGHGTIRSSLFEAAAAAGLTDKTTIELANIFQWDIDFWLDVRSDDRFSVLYQELWRDGVKIGNGAILAAEFVNQGKSYRAARYTNADGRTDYFTPAGRSVRRAFVRAPVDFTRISGNFDPSRRHPILNTIRAHRGVDYAAPSGTPVRAAGDGRIIQRGRNGGFGNSVTIQHGNSITTLYAHLSRFADHRTGSRVSQNDIIGYVGKTGLATGPHLHYEYRVNGVHRNPRTVPLPPADPVAPQYQEDFQSVSAALWSQLDLYQQAWLARVQN